MYSWIEESLFIAAVLPEEFRCFPFAMDSQNYDSKKYKQKTLFYYISSDRLIFVNPAATR